MNEQLIPYIINENGEVIVSARALHNFLQIKTPFKVWVPRMIEYGFEENEDYKVVLQKHKIAGGVQDCKDYMLSSDMAKEICMLQRTERGRQARLYFINLEKKFNSPEAILARLIKILITKWLINTARIVYNNEGNMNVEGVLTLQGSQGMGKTRFIKKIIPLYVKTGLDLDSSDKDKINQCIKYWVCELGELDSTLKKDLAKLKAFLTEQEDEYRKPYAALS